MPPKGGNPVGTTGGRIEASCVSLPKSAAIPSRESNCAIFRNACETIAQGRREGGRADGRTASSDSPSAVSVICQGIIEQSFAELARARARRNYQKSSKKSEKAISRRAVVFLQFWRGAIDTRWN